MAANQSVESAEMTPPAPPVDDPALAARSAELQRINWLTIYAPVLLVTVIALLLLGVLAWAALFAGESVPPQIDRASGIADTFLILVCLIPLTLMCAILPLGGLGFLYWRQQNGSIVRERTQTLLRKVDGGISTANDKVNETSPKVANVVIQARSNIEGGFVLLDKMINWVKNGVSNQINQPDGSDKQSQESDK